MIDDELHAELQKGKFETFEEAVVELKRLAEIPWNEAPNRAPCTIWKQCGRKYTIREYKNFDQPIKLLQEIPALEISASGVKWLIDPK